MLGNLLDYLQRVYQPRLSTALAGDPGPLLAAARRGTGLVLAALPLPLAALFAAGRLPGLPGALAAVLAVTPVLVAAALLSWLLENLDAAALRRSTLAAVAALAVTAAAAPLAVPALGAVGGLLALLADAAAQLLLLRPGPAPTPRPLPTGRPA